jgi:hypothetical protein
LRRHRALLTPHPRILVVCEGAKAETGYLNDLKSSEQVRTLRVKVVGGAGAPEAVVQRAISLRDDAATEARRRGDRNLRYDEAWCVLDVDVHPRLDEALRLADQETISVALSNPCFELWLLLHFQDQRAHLDAREAKRLCRTHLPQYERRLTFRELASGYGDALRRAEELAEWQQANGRPGANPCTTFHTLTKRLKALAGRTSR